MLGFTIGLRTLRAAQQSMDLVGQNVANASTPGYTRRLAELRTADPLFAGRFALGTGVLTADLRSVHDDLLEARLREQHQALGRLESSSPLLSSLEGYLGEPSDDGLAARLDQLWNGFSGLTSAPADSSQRAGLVQSADALATRFREIAAQIASVGEEARQRTSSAVDEVNALTGELAGLNARIVKGRALGSTPADLIDERNRLLTSLADWIDPQIVERKDGSVDVLLDGRLLVAGDRATKLDVVLPGDGTVSVRIAGAKNDVAIGDGQLRGLLDLAQTKVPQRQQELDAIARQLVAAVNRRHATSVNALGPFTQLTSNVAVSPDEVDQPLASADLPSALVAGRLTVNVVDAQSGAVAQHFIDVDPQTMSLRDLATALDALPHLSASVDASGRLAVAAEQGFGFDFSRRLDVDPDDAGSFGSARATITSGAGPFALQAGDTLALAVNGGAPVTVTFAAGDFADITHATADEVAAVLNAQVPGLTAVAQDGRLVLSSGVAGPNGSLQVTSATNSALFAAGTSDTGADPAVAVQLTGAPTAGDSGHFTVRALGDGVVGLTPGLKIELLDEQGASRGTFDVGSGYTPGNPIELVPGVKLALSVGSIQKSSGDVFEFDLVANSDTSDVLAGLQLGALFTGRGAADVAVARDVADDPRRLAGSRDGNTQDGSGFLDLAALKDETSAELGGRTIAQSFGDLVANVGLDVSTNQSSTAAQQQLLTSFETRRQEISGVNTDEEMLKLVEYQHLYQAAGRYLQSVNDVQDTLLNLL